MTKEHYYHIVEKFKHCFSANNRWTDRLSNIIISELFYINYFGSGLYVIDYKSCSRYIFTDIKNESYAKEILQYIKDTEILFI